MARNRTSFGDSAATGMAETYKPKKHEPVIEEEKPASEIEKSSPGLQFEVDQGLDEIPIQKEEKVLDKSPGSVNRYYTYHPKSGSKGGQLGAPRVQERRVQISIGCTEAEKSLYQKAAKADGRKLSDFVNHAIYEYLHNHNIIV